jgi:hypothetical protein
LARPVFDGAGMGMLWGRVSQFLVPCRYDIIVQNKY